MPDLKRILVANRGEVAIRIIRACRELGIETVAVYSEADRGSRHVALADRAVCIGPRRAAESYLNIQALLATARLTGCDAIHPGYGFLAENATFASACAEAGLVFIGPAPDAIRLMGDKAESRRVAQEAGVPIVPGSGCIESEVKLVALAKQIGFPLLLKAAAGGGGRGMRLVRSLDDLNLIESFQAARAEAGAAFGSDAVYLERYLERVHHVEVQVLADLHGNCVHLGERECSVQRRHQKLLGEAPSPSVDGRTREEMAAAAVSLCRHIGYRNAGTVEFIVDEETGRFYFIEMNTRLQVEHPVTEMVTGIDIVMEQLRVAAGEPLSFRQSDVELRGHAMECRIVAEDPNNGFAPCPGRILAYQEPGGPGVRVDSYCQSGSQVPPEYDSLLAKVVTWGRDRKEAVRRMERALAEYRIEGVATTIPFHRYLLKHPDFLAGRVHTRWVETEFQPGVSS